MEPLFFGAAERPLYGVYHAPQRMRAANAGVLLCYPAGQEYIRIHRAYRWLADQLSAAGFHVLRFDYTGQGDSAGSFDEARLPQWARDAQCALDELRALTGATDIDVVGLRIGTLVATSLTHHASVRRVVLWEPRASGTEFAQELTASLLSDGSSLSSHVDELGLVDLFGFAYHPQFLEELQAAPMPPALRPSQSALLVLAAPRDLTAAESALAAHGGRTTLKIVDSPTDWNSIDDMGGLFLPVPTLRSIVEWLDA